MNHLKKNYKKTLQILKACKYKMRVLSLIGTNLNLDHRSLFTWNKSLLKTSWDSEGFVLLESIIAHDIWEENELWNDLRGLMEHGGSVVRKRDVRNLSVHSANKFN